MEFVKVPKKRLLLTEEDFTTLVSGNILVKGGVEIALQDIGYQLMKRIIDRQNNNHTLTTDELTRLNSMLGNLDLSGLENLGEEDEDDLTNLFNL